MPFSKYSPKQKKLARAAKPRNKITGADYKAMKKKKKKKKLWLYDQEYMRIFMRKEKG